jgi:long-chain acyl-CoA synthetase
MNIACNLVFTARFHPDRPVLLEENAVCTYSELNAESDRAAAALAARGFRPGDRAAICLPNGRMWVAAYYGIIKAGGTAVTLFAGMPAGELKVVLDDSQPKILFTTGDKPAGLGDRKDRPYLETIVAPNGDLTWDAFMEGAPKGFETVERDRDDIAAILYTGGTTGAPKGVMLSHENIMTSAQNGAMYERSTENDRALCFLPLHHVFGQVHILNAAIFSAGSVVLMNGFLLDKVMDAVPRLKVTKFYAVPTVYMRLVTLPDIRQRLASVRYCFSAAASMARELVRAWNEATGLNIFEAYGLTESSAIATYNHYYRHKIGSVGTPVGSIEAAILDTSGQPLETGREGEICLRGPSIMKGYFNRPQETRAAFWGPWFRSGDIGLMDEEGYLFIVDRLKDMIITGGENVYPREVEEQLYLLDEVEECAVVGLPDPEYGERVVAMIRTRPGTELAADKVKKHLKERLSGYKVPKDYHISRDEFPRSPAGKILKREIRKQLASEPGAEAKR